MIVFLVVMPRFGRVNVGVLAVVEIPQITIPRIIRSLVARKDDIIIRNRVLHQAASIVFSDHSLDACTRGELDNLNIPESWEFAPDLVPELCVFAFQAMPSHGFDQYLIKPIPGLPLWGHLRDNRAHGCGKKDCN
jgi:hypothetical protein